MDEEKGGVTAYLKSHGAVRVGDVLHYYSNVLRQETDAVVLKVYNSDRIRVRRQADGRTSDFLINDSTLGVRFVRAAEEVGNNMGNGKSCSSDSFGSTTKETDVKKAYRGIIIRKDSDGNSTAVAHEGIVFAVDETQAKQQVLVAAATAGTVKADENLFVAVSLIG